MWGEEPRRNGRSEIVRKERKCEIIIHGQAAEQEYFSACGPDAAKGQQGKAGGIGRLSAVGRCAVETLMKETCRGKDDR